MFRNITTAGATLLIAVAPGVHAQSQSPRPQFEVASIRFSPNQNAGRVGLLYTLSVGQITARGITLRALIFEAYDLKAPEELKGAPDWIDTVRWDLDAESAGHASRTEMMTMLRSLLEDKFKLVVHNEHTNVAGSEKLPNGILAIDNIQRPSEN